eukprot:COSAG03_NODE_518_length_7242_cov_58.514350_3_plen_200_part_00
MCVCVRESERWQRERVCVREGKYRRTFCLIAETRGESMRVGVTDGVLGTRVGVWRSLKLPDLISSIKPPFEAGAGVDTVGSIEFGRFGVHLLSCKLPGMISAITSLCACGSTGGGGDGGDGCCCCCCCRRRRCCCCCCCCWRCCSAGAKFGAGTAERCGITGSGSFMLLSLSSMILHLQRQHNKQVAGASAREAMASVG